LALARREGCEQKNGEIIPLIFDDFPRLPPVLTIYGLLFDTRGCPRRPRNARWFRVHLTFVGEGGRFPSDTRALWLRAGVSEPPIVPLLSDDTPTPSLAFAQGEYCSYHLNYLQGMR
jgi:hypothetical protein